MSSSLLILRSSLIVAALAGALHALGFMLLVRNHAALITSVRDASLRYSSTGKYLALLLFIAAIVPAAAIAAAVTSHKWLSGPHKPRDIAWMCAHYALLHALLACLASLGVELVANRYGVTSQYPLMMPFGAFALIPANMAFFALTRLVLR